MSLIALAMLGSVVPAAAIEGRPIVNGDGDTAGKCLTISNNGAGPNVIMERCNGTEHQNWVYVYHNVTILDTTARAVAIFSGHPSWRNWCINGGNQGTHLEMALCNRTTPRGQTEYWLPSNPIGGQWAQFKNFFHQRFYNLNLCMDVRDNGLGAAVQTWTCKTTGDGGGLANQLWKVA